MPIQLPNLDDRRYGDLFAEMRALIPRYAPEWTDHNESDPGIMLLELFAWLTEALIYRINRIPGASEVRFLELLGMTMQPAQPAVRELRLTVTGLPQSASIDVRTGLPKSVCIDAGTPLIVSAPADFTPRSFVTTRDITLTFETPEAVVQAEAVVQVRPARRASERLGTSDGKPHQIFRLSKEFVLLDPPPEVKVGGRPWTYRTNLAGASPEDEIFTLDPRLNAICFGDERQDVAIPQGNLKALRLGGQIPPAGAAIHATYDYTLGDNDVLPAELEFELDESSPELSEDILHLLESGATFTFTSSSSAAAQGANPMDLEEARYQAIRELRRRCRAVTEEDFELLVLQNENLNVARAKCLSDVDLTACDPYAYRPGHVSLIILPKLAAGSVVECPVPTDDLVNQVSKYLDERRLLTCHLHVVGPRYVDMWVEAEVIQMPRTKRDEILKNIKNALAAFFSPMPNGTDHGGWPFGRHVRVSEVHQVIEGTQGVDHVESLTVRRSRGCRFGDDTGSADRPGCARAF